MGKKYLFVCLLSFLLKLSLFGEVPVKFRRVSPVGGFGIEPIQSIVQDTLGMIWFCSTEGLYRYNANEFKAYHINEVDSLDLSSERFEFVYEDVRKTLWVGTMDGLLRYDRQNDRLVAAQIKQGSERVPLDGSVRHMVEDEQNQIWMVWNDCLGIYDPQKETFQAYKHPGGDFPVLFLTSDSSGQLWVGGYGKVFRYEASKAMFTLFSQFGRKQVNDILVESDGKVWIASEGDGVFCIDSLGSLVKQYKHSYENENTLSENLVRKLLRDKRGNLWIGTYRGLNLLSCKRQGMQRIYAGKDEGQGLPNNSVYELYADRNGNIWIGSWSGGLAFMNEYDHKFNHLKQEDKGRGLADNVVSSFAEDLQGNLWIGTEKGGLNYWDRHSGEFEWFQQKVKGNSVSGNNIKDLVFDHLGNLWIATHGNGLCKRETKSGRFTHFIPQGEEHNSVAYSNVYALEMDSVLGLWVGTSGKGLDYLDFKTHKFIHYPQNPVDIITLRSNFVSSLLLDHKKNLWVGTVKGLSLFDIKHKRYKELILTGEGKRVLNRSIVCLYEDSSHAIWVGTNGSGLFRINPEKLSVESYGLDMGLAAYRVYGIIEDDEKNLWVSSSNGIFCRFAQDSGFVHFDRSDGLQSNLFSKGAVYCLSSGELAFGGTNGFNVFDPTRFRKNRVTARPLISSMKIYNTLVTPKTHPSVLKNDITLASEVVLDHTQKSFGLEFCYPSFLVPQKNRFRYKLEGEDKIWNEVGVNRRNVTYSNLSPGNYIFHLQACNNDGIWSPQETSLNIKVKPAPWLTWWAFILYVFIMLVILWGVIRFYWGREKQRNLIRMEKEKAEDIHQMKLQFFANVSHEFRTPLTLIQGPVQQLMNEGDMPPKMHSSFQIINRNTRRLLHLVNQLMDFMKLENEGMHVVYTSGDVAGFVKETGELFLMMATHNDVEYTMSIQDTGVALFDKDKMEKILFNLLSNAFKYTPRDGCVELKSILETTNKKGFNKLILQVSNTGTPIPTNVMSKIFLPYYQHTSNQSDLKQGTGIGLALTKDLVEVLGGEITVTSNEEATSFRVILPLQMTEEEPERESQNDKGLREVVASLTSKQTASVDEDMGRRRMVKVLVVEDNTELLDFLEDRLKRYFCVSKAANGKQALEMATQVTPDVIVSDVMMPQMNGLDLCSLIKTTNSLCHIPVILLTARSSKENRIEGLDYGADAYIQKPFDTDYLIATIRNLNRQRKQLRMVFGKKITVDAKEVDIPSEDEQFLKNAAGVVEQYLENEEFNVSVFVREMGMGKTLLYQKMKSLTGMSVNEFILNLRMKRAEQLLRDSDLNVTQIATQVGFKNANYFSTCFKNQFKMSPKKYQVLIRKELS